MSRPIGTRNVLLYWLNQGWYLINGGLYLSKDCYGCSKRKQISIDIPSDILRNCKEVYSSTGFNSKKLIKGRLKK